jgi:hypothetical protein
VWLSKPRVSQSRTGVYRWADFLGSLATVTVLHFFPRDGAMPSRWIDIRNCYSFTSALESISTNVRLALVDLRSTTSYYYALKSIIANIECSLADIRSTPYWSLDYIYLGLLSTFNPLYWEAKVAQARRINWLIFRWINATLIQSEGKSLCNLSRRPPPRGRRRSCASASNPKPQPSVISEYLSRYPSKVRGSTSRLATDSCRNHVIGSSSL